MTFRTINGRPILWYEPKSNVTHVCEGCYVSPPMDRTRLIWTLCRVDVPANAAAAPPEFVAITCPECLAALPAEQSSQVA